MLTPIEALHLPDNFDDLYDELALDDDELEYPDNDDIEEDDNYLELDIEEPEELEIGWYDDELEE